MNVETLAEHMRIGCPEDELTTLQLYLDAAIAHVTEYLGDDLPDPLPEPVSVAILLLAGDMYLNRERQSEQILYANRTYNLLLSPYKKMEVL